MFEKKSITFTQPPVAQYAMLRMKGWTRPSKMKCMTAFMEKSGIVTNTTLRHHDDLDLLRALLLAGLALRAFVRALVLWEPSRVGDM